MIPLSISRLCRPLTHHCVIVELVGDGAQLGEDELPWHLGVLVARVLGAMPAEDVQPLVDLGHHHCRAVHNVALDVAVLVLTAWGKGGGFENGQVGGQMAGGLNVGVAVLFLTARGEGGGLMSRQVCRWAGRCDLYLLQYSHTPHSEPRSVDSRVHDDDLESVDGHGVHHTDGLVDDRVLKQGQRAAPARIAVPSY